MLIIKAGTELKEREEANKYIRDNYSTFTEKILRKEELALIPQYFEVDIFGDKTKIYLEDWNAEDYRDFVYKYLEEIRDSENIFIIDETDILDATFKKLCKYGYKETIFDAREVKGKESAFYFGDLFLMRKKKEAWLELLRLINAGEPVESIAGALIYKIKVSRMNNGLKNDLIFKIMALVAMDHDGKCEAKKEMEKLILII